MTGSSLGNKCVKSFHWGGTHFKNHVETSWAKNYNYVWKHTHTHKHTQRNIHTHINTQIIISPFIKSTSRVCVRHLLSFFHTHSPYFLHLFLEMDLRRTHVDCPWVPKCTWPPEPVLPNFENSTSEKNRCDLRVQ